MNTDKTFGLLFFLLLLCSPAFAAGPTLAIPQIPLTNASPVRPQVLIVIGNSTSMSGTLSGAIMTGSGTLPSDLTSLSASSSPIKYLVPAGFTPPIQGPDAFSMAPYCVKISGDVVDNGPTRLNMAKAGISAILQTYMASTDFALGVFDTTMNNPNQSWLYMMSPAGSDFIFTNTQTTGKRYAINPCYNYTSASSKVKNDCTSLDGFYAASIGTFQFIEVSATSDDYDINSVLSGGISQGVFIAYGGPSPATPFAPNFTLTNYNNSSVILSYSTTRPSTGGGLTAGPTNAGYSIYSKQAMFSARGYRFVNAVSATKGKILVPMTNIGSAPTTANINTAINAFTPYLKPQTDNESSNEVKGDGVQSPIAGLLKTAKTYLAGTVATNANSCPIKKYVILVSDGLPTLDLNNKRWPPLGTASGNGYGVTATFNADGSLNSTNSQAVTDAIAAIKNLKDNGIQTYVIGMGAGVDPLINPLAAKTLTAMAVAGGTTDYYPATSPQDIVNDLDTILIAIQNGTFSNAAAAVSSTRLSTGSIEFQANFTSGDFPYQDWTGDLKAIPLDSTTGIPTGAVNWAAKGLLDSKTAGLGWSSNRIITTWNPTTSSGVPFQWASISTSQKNLLQPAPSDGLGQSRLEYLRGNANLEKRNGGTFRNRSHILGDIINSQVVYVGEPSGPYLTSAYGAFITANSNRTPMLYVGANDGMLHAFNAATGEEVFAFIPNGVFANLINLTSPIYNSSHLYSVDGSPQVADVQFADGSWHTLLVSGENSGGKTIFSLDVTNPDLLTGENALATAVMWEFGDSDMGFSFSQPQIAQIGSANASPSTFATFFGNGYSNPNNNAVLYAVNAQTGTLIAKINLCAAVVGACNGSLVQGLSSVAVANKDGLQGQPITNVYAGDLQGNLWSINVSDSNPTNWTVRLLFQARSSAGDIQPITTAPVISLHPNYPRKQGLFLMFGTGQLLVQSDILSTQTQSVYGVWDQPQTVAIFTRAELQSQTLSFLSAASTGLPNSILTGTTNAVNWTTKNGWYADLAVTGQRVITNPTVLNGAFIATLNTPPLDLCSTGFTSMLLELNFQTGGAFTTGPQLDINGDYELNASDKYLGGYAVGLGLSNSYATAPNVIGPNANGNLIILVTQSNGTQSTVSNANNQPRKIGWWQIQ